MKRTVLALVSALVFFSAFSAFSATKSLEVKGTVSQDGTPVSAGYKVSIQNLAQPARTNSAATDSTGKYGKAFVDIFAPVANDGDTIQVDVKTPLDSPFATATGIYSGGTSITIDVSVTTTPTPPTAPSSLSLNVTTSGISLTWTDNSLSETGFRIEKRVGGTDVPFVVLTTTTANIITYTDSFSPVAGTTYTYRVYAINGFGSSSPAESGTTIATTTPLLPTAPTNFQAVATETSVSLSWQNTATNATENKVSRSFGGEPFVEIATVSASATGYVDNGVARGTAYTYRLVAINATGSSSIVETTAIVPVGLPTAPINVVATATSETTASLSWQNTATNATEIKIDKSVSNDTAFTTIQILVATATSATVTGLAEGTVYRFRIGAANVNGVFWSSTTSVTTPIILPGDPTGLTAVASETSVQLSWVDNSTNETGFEVQARVGQFGAYGTVTTTAANATAYIHTGLTPGEKYTYHVRAVRVGGASNWSAESSATISIPVPPTPSGVSANAVSETQINVSWADVTGEDGYRVEIAAPSAGFTLAGQVGEGVVTLSATGLTANTAYRFRVIAWNAGGNSSPSVEVSATTFTTPVPVVTTPTGLVASTASQNTINLAWNAVSDATGYKIGWRYGSQPFSELISLGAVTTYQVNELTANTTYVFAVQAVKGTSVSNWSGEVSATTLSVPGTPILTAPSAVVLIVNGEAAITVSWTDNSNNETGFEVWRRLASSPMGSLVATVAANVTTYQNTGLLASTAYAFSVRAKNTSGNSAFSAEATATTSAATVPTTPATPLNFTAVASSSQVFLSWEYSPPVDGFRLTGIFGTLELNSGQRTYTVGGLSSSTAYSFTLVAVRGTLLSLPVTVLTTTGAPTVVTVPSPAIPANITITASTENSLTVTWDHSLANTNSFEFQRDLVTVGTPVETKFLDVGLVPGTAYSYRVRALGPGGISSWSVTTTGKTAPASAVVTPKPTAPKNLKAETLPSVKGVTLTWEYSGETPENFLLKKKVSTGDEIQLAIVPAGQRSFKDESDTIPDTPVTYRLFAVAKGGALSDAAEATITVPKVPVVESVSENTTITVIGSVAYADGSPILERDAKSLMVAVSLKNVSATVAIEEGLTRFSVTLASRTTLIKTGDSLTIKIYQGVTEVASKNVTPKSTDIASGATDVGAVATSILQSTTRLAVSGKIVKADKLFKPVKAVAVTNTSRKINPQSAVPNENLFEVTFIGTNPVAWMKDVISVEIFSGSGKSLGLKTMTLTTEQIKSGKVEVVIEPLSDWDVFGDGVIDIADLVVIGKAFGETGIATRADVNGDLVVNIVDLVLVATHFGETTAKALSAPALPRKEDAPLLEKWLSEARAANDGSATFRRGIATLEMLLGAFVPARTELLQNFPNPFNPETWIPFQLAESAEVTVEIITVSGELVRTLNLGVLAAGSYKTKNRAAYWDGNNQNGESVASGLYLYRVKTGSVSQMRRMILLK